MIVLASVLLAALLATNYLWLREFRKGQEASWRREQALLNRMQFPERVPPEHVTVPPDEELRTAPDLGEWDLAGTIQTGRDGDG